MANTSISPDFAAAFKDVPGFANFGQDQPNLNTPISPDFAAAFKDVPGFANFGQDTTRPNPVTRLGVNLTLGKISSAGERAGEFAKKSAIAVKDLLINNLKYNKAFWASFVAGGAITLGLAEGLHQPNLALYFPMLTAILGETPIALASIYKTILPANTRTVDQNSLRIDKIKNISRKTADWLADIVTDKAYKKAILGLTTGGITGFAAAGVADHIQQIHAAQAVNQPVLGDRGNDALEQTRGTSGFGKSGQAPPSWNSSPPPSDIQHNNPPPSWNSSPPPSDIQHNNPPPPTLQETVNTLSPQVNMLTLHNDPSLAGLGHNPWYWNAAEKWIEPIAKQMGLSHQAQLYLTDAVTDVIKTQGPVGQVRNVQFDLTTIANHILDGVGRNGVPGVDMKHVSAGQVSELLKGIKEIDLTQIGQAAEFMLKKATATGG